MTDCGLTPAEIREMTMADVERLYAHWRKHPPLRAFMEAWLGYEPPVDDKPKQYMTAESVSAFADMMNRLPIARA
jgi:hypothetical protein